MGQFKVRSKRGFLVGIMEALAGDARISFEGTLDGLVYWLDLAGDARSCQ